MLTPAKTSGKSSQFLTAIENPELWRAIKVSILFHVILFIALAIRMAFGPNEPLIMEHSIRVDIVGLPDKSAAIPLAPAPSEQKMQNPPMVKPDEKPKEKPKEKSVTKTDAKPESEKPVLPKPLAKTTKIDPEKINLTKTKREQEDAIKRLGAMEKLQHLKDPSTSSSDRPETTEAKKVQSQIKGNAVSQGSALSGVSRIENDNYIEKTGEQIRRHWNLPHWLSTANLSALVRLFIDEHGNLLKKELVRSSKNAIFDESVIRAIDAALPFSRPPSDLADRIAISGIEIEFVPSDG